jgi:hypothetical protein
MDVEDPVNPGEYPVIEAPKRTWWRDHKGLTYTGCIVCAVIPATMVVGSVVALLFIL